MVKLITQHAPKDPPLAAHIARCVVERSAPVARGGEGEEAGSFGAAQVRARRLKNFPHLVYPRTNPDRTIEPPRALYMYVSPLMRIYMLHPRPRRPSWGQALVPPSGRMVKPGVRGFNRFFQ